MRYLLSSLLHIATLAPTRRPCRSYITSRTLRAMAAIASSSAATAGPAATSTDPTNAAKPVKMSTDSTLPPRTLVLCFDGTSNQYDGDVSS